MEYIEVSARTVDDAITEALIKLGATSDQIEYEVIEKGSTGFLGIARKDAVIKVRKKYSVEGDITEFLQKIFAAMDLKVEIIIEKAESRKNIKELFADYHGEYTPIEIDWGEPVGEEVW